MSYVQLSNKHKIDLPKLIEKNKPMSVPFLCWDLYENPVLPSTKQSVQSVKTCGQLEKPPYVIIGFQTERKRNMEKFLVSLIIVKSKCKALKKE